MPARPAYGWMLKARWVAGPAPPEPAMPRMWLRRPSHAAASIAAATIRCATRTTPPALAAYEPRVPHYPDACPGRYLRLQLPRVEGTVLSRQVARRQDAQLLRRAPAHGRDQLY